MWLFFEKYEVNELHIPICGKTESELGIYFEHPNFILSEKRLKSHIRIFIFQVYQAWVNSAPYNKTRVRPGSYMVYIADATFDYQIFQVP